MNVETGLVRNILIIVRKITSAIIVMKQIISPKNVPKMTNAKLFVSISLPQKNIYITRSRVMV